MALTLEESIARVPFLAEARDIKSTPLGGGITNLNYKIDADGHSYVLRITGADTDKLGIKRDVEHQANLEAGKLGVAPEVVFFIEPEGYLPAELIVALLFAIIMGLRRINKTDILQYNGAFLEMLCLERFPDQSTLRRFLKRLSPQSIRQLVRLHDSLRAYLCALPHQRNSLVFDLDSTVLIIYGRAEGPRVGYNPKKPGRRSYHPLLCFEASFQEFWHGSLRPGNAGASTGAVPFLKVCLAKVPSAIARSRIRLRMDSGFYGSRVIRFLDASGCGYVMVAREYRNSTRISLRPLARAVRT